MEKFTRSQDCKEMSRQVLVQGDILWVQIGFACFVSRGSDNLCFRWVFQGYFLFLQQAAFGDRDGTSFYSKRQSALLHIIEDSDSLTSRFFCHTNPLWMLLSASLLCVALQDLGFRKPGQMQMLLPGLIKSYDSNPGVLCLHQQPWSWLERLQVW